MTLRRTAVPLRRSPSWRRSGDDSHWESLLSGGGEEEEEEAPRRAPRPQSVQMDDWPREPARTRIGHLPPDPVPDHYHVRGPPFTHPTATAAATMPTLGDQDPPARHPASPRQAWSPPSPLCGREDYQSSGTPSVCDSSLGSQDSLLLHPGVSRGLSPIMAPAERRDSWERAHIVEVPNKEQARVSSLASVRIGWLPTQGRVWGLGAVRSGQNQNQNQNQQADTSANSTQVRQINFYFKCGEQ